MAVAIIGAGAAGLMLANILEQNKIEYVLFEREARVGKKLLATGNGRCNLSNLDLRAERYHGDREFAENIINNYPLCALEETLSSLGIPARYEENKVFPYSLQASAVLDMMRLNLHNVKTETEVLKITLQKKGYLLKTKNGEEFFEIVVLAVGGKASKKLSGGGSYNLLCDLGYKLTELRPAIVQLKCEGTRALEGIKINARVTLEDRKETDEVLFTSYGLSGPAILQLSRDAVGKKLKIDAFPEIPFNELFDIMLSRKKIKDLTLENLFTGLINKKLGTVILKRADVLPLSKKVTELETREIKSICNQAKNMEFCITDTNGFENAQVTAGGIQTSDFDSKTLESKKHKNLYALGEMLNVDGDCGGFNLHFAFACASVCAKAIIQNRKDN